MIAFRVMRRFCGMKYYREIAEFLKIKVHVMVTQVPVLNEEIRIVEGRDCVVHGIKKMQEETPIPLPIEENP